MSCSPSRTLRPAHRFATWPPSPFDFGPPSTTDQRDPHDPSKGVDPAKQCLNTIDAGAPTSKVAALPAKVSGNSVTVSWSGLDEKGAGSGIACYDVYVSKDNGAYSLWQTRTTAASAKYTGMIGHCYAFYCVATDNVGHREAKSPAAEAKVTFQLLTTTSVTSSLPTGSVSGRAVTFTAVVKAAAGGGVPGGTVTFKDGATILGTATLSSAGQAVLTISTLGVGNHAITAVYSGNASFQASSGTVQQVVKRAAALAAAFADVACERDDTGAPSNDDLSLLGLDMPALLSILGNGRSQATRAGVSASLADEALVVQ